MRHPATLLRRLSAAPCPSLIITGIGVVTPLGGCVVTTLAALARGDVAPRAATTNDLGADYSHRTDLIEAGSLPGVARVSDDALDARPPCYSTPASAGAARGAARFALLADVAAGEAAGQAKLPPDGHSRIGVAIGNALGGFEELASAGAAVAAAPRGGLRRLGPYFVPRVLPNMAAGHVSIGRGLRGPLAAPAAGCGAGLAALASAARVLTPAGGADAVLAGGAEACVSAPALAALAAALNGGGDTSSRALAEGAAALVIERQGARHGAPPPLARLLGTSTATGDAGTAAAAAAGAALARAGVPPSRVAVVFTPHPAATSALCPVAITVDTRPALGDALAAAGAIDAALVVAALSGAAPPLIAPTALPGLAAATEALAQPGAIALVVTPCFLGGGAAAAVFGGVG